MSAKLETTPDSHIVVIDLSPSVQMDFAIKKYNDKFGKENGHLHLAKPVGIANILYKHMGFPGAMFRQVAILYDLVNSTDTTLEEIKAQFGSQFSDIVLQCTYDKKLSLQQQKEKMILDAKNWDFVTKYIVLAEMIYNLCMLNETYAPHGWTQIRIQQYASWCMIFLAEMMQISSKLQDSTGDQLIASLTKQIVEALHPLSLENSVDLEKVKELFVEYVVIQ